MDSTLPDAFEASQSGPGTGQTLGGGSAGLESMGKTSSAGPFVKVDGTLALKYVVGFGRSLTSVCRTPEI